MELYGEILAQLLKQDLVEGRCYLALKEIKAILEDDRLSDEECFGKIEAIVRVFEDLGSDCGTRRDFG